MLRFMILFVLATWCFAGEAAAPPALLSPAENAAVIKLAEQAVKLGLPDAKGAKVVKATLKLTWKENEKENSRSMEGFHLQCADGTWLVSGMWKPSPAVTVTVADSKEVPLADLEAEATRNSKGKWDPSGMDELLEKVAVADRPRAKLAIDCIPIIIGFQANQPAGLSVLILNLARMDAPSVPALAVISGLGTTWDTTFDDYFAAKAEPISFGAARDRWARYSERMESMKEIAIPDPVATLRRGLHMYFRNLGIAKPRATVLAPTPETALAAAESLLVESETGPKAELALLRERLALPSEAAPDADLRTRLASWEATASRNYEEEDEMETTEIGPSEEDLAELPAEIRAEFEKMQGTKKKKVAAFTEKDLEGLIGLVGDGKASRWLDGTHPRTVGDNALRALAQVFGCDPRSFTKQALDAPWNDAERNATAKALATWWTTAKGKPFSEILVQAIPTMSLADLVRVLKARPAADRAALFDLVATAWKAGPPDGDDDQFVALLALAKGHAGLAAVVDSWPVTGDLEMVLTARRLAAGDSADLDRLFTAALEGGEIEYNHYEIFALAALAPKPDYLNRLAKALAGPLDQPSTISLIQLVSSGMSYGGSAVQMFEQLRAKDKDAKAAQRRAHALPLALVAVLLADTRPAPQELREQLSHHRVFSEDGKEEEKPKPPAADLRVCDCIGVQFQQLIWRFNEVFPDQLRQRRQELSIEPAAELADRDQRLGEIRAIVNDALPGCLTAAGLPAIAPGAPAGAGDEKSLF